MTNLNTRKSIELDADATYFHVRLHGTDYPFPTEKAAARFAAAHDGAEVL